MSDCGANEAKSCLSLEEGAFWQCIDNIPVFKKGGDLRLITNSLNLMNGLFET